MEKYQVTNVANVIIEHLGGKIEMIYWPISENKLMVSNI
jgi:hypothetical protein